MLCAGIIIWSVPLGCDDEIVCGDGVAEYLERCDQADLRQATCLSLGYYGGELTCAADCTYDTSQCEPDPCVVFGYYGDGQMCDACELFSDVGVADSDCHAQCAAADGHCASYYSQLAQGWTCALTGHGPDPDCGECGNGVAEMVEQCDGTDFKGRTCEDYGWYRGTLQCSAECRIDFTECPY